MNTKSTVQAIRWNGESLFLLDQRLLPNAVVEIEFGDAIGVAAAIRDMVVRGAPAIGVTAAYGGALSVAQHLSSANWRAAVEADLQVLEQARPTAVNLAWAVAQVREQIESNADNPLHAVRRLAEKIHADDVAANRRMGEFGAALIEQRCQVLTHCNAGALATAGYGTALGVIRSAYAAGKIERVFADETRPWLQGSRLTAWELLQDDIPVTLIADGAATWAMRQGEIRWVIVGADRVAANGDVANKIGTYSVAVSARHHGVRFMVAAPTSTIDANCPNGDAIPIEQRDAAELFGLAGVRHAAPGAQAWNPVFDVTPADLVDALVTEKGVIMKPDAVQIAALLASA
ncbi:MAG: methylthioribose-1-phosphate isomerase [Gammaproteobacteria bacterium]|jgi:methylthioribose-1-phosphate isomerase